MAVLIIIQTWKNEHVKTKIKPALKQKRVVICDRFIDSTIAYQVYGKKVNIKFIKNIHKYILNGLKPNLTFVLKVSSKSSRKRLSKRERNQKRENIFLSSKVLIVDDICDSGETFERLSNYIKENINHECEVRFSALWRNNECDFEPHYYIRDLAKDTDKVWIFFPHENWWEGSIS